MRLYLYGFIEHGDCVGLLFLAFSRILFCFTVNIPVFSKQCLIGSVLSDNLSKEKTLRDAFITSNNSCGCYAVAVHRSANWAGDCYD